jgi:hypothetical protein
MKELFCHLCCCYISFWLSWLFFSGGSYLAILIWLFLYGVLIWLFLSGVFIWLFFLALPIWLSYLAVLIWLF